MSRQIVACALLSTVLLTGCAGAPEKYSANGLNANAAPTAWSKYHIAGSRIPRTLDARGQPLTGSQVTTITDEDLKSSSGILLGDKLSGGYPR